MAEGNRQVAIVEVYREGLAKMQMQFEAALPEHIRPAKFMRVAMSAIQNADQSMLRDADRKSVYGSIMNCAQDGLMMDGREAALVFYKGKAQYQPMVRGIMKLARNSGEISKIVSQVVYENDEFDIQFVTDHAPVVHRPNLKSRGMMIGVYALAKLKDGVWTDPEWMDNDQVNAIKARSRAPNGPWRTDFEQMALKTVIKRAAKRWPSSTDLDDALSKDEDEYDDEPVIRGTMHDIDPTTGEIVGDPLPPVRRRKTRASEAVAAKGRKQSDDEDEGDQQQPTGPTTIDADYQEVAGGDTDSGRGDTEGAGGEPEDDEQEIPI